MKASGLFAAALALCLVQSVLCQSEAEETNVRPNPQEGQRQPPQSPARQRPQPGIGGLLSGKQTFYCMIGCSYFSGHDPFVLVYGNH